jgi:hypothetical protein
MKKPLTFIFFVLFFALGPCLTFAQQPITNKAKSRLQKHINLLSNSQSPRNEWNVGASFMEKIQSIEILPQALRANLPKHRNGQKRNEPASFTSKLYAQFTEQKSIDQIAMQFGLRIYQNRYQIVPGTNAIMPRSQSMFVFQPCISSAYVWDGPVPGSIEYQAGLHVTPAPQLERRIEFLHNGLPQRWMGWIGWVGKVAVKLEWPTLRQRRPINREK